MKTKTNKLKIGNVIINHIKNNLREYIIISLIFILGIFLGVMFVNNCKENHKEEITNYLNDYVGKLKENNKINSNITLKENIKENVILAIILWFTGTTIIGIPIVFGIIMYRGFCIGYTISSCVYTMGIKKGLAFIFTTIFLQNIIFIPAIIALGVSGMKLYKSIMRDKRRENIKLEIIRHSIFSVIMLIVLIISAIVKICVSGYITENLIKYF